MKIQTSILQNLKNKTSIPFDIPSFERGSASQGRIRGSVFFNLVRVNFLKNLTLSEIRNQGQDIFGPGVKYFPKINRIPSENERKSQRNTKKVFFFACGALRPQKAIKRLILIRCPKPYLVGKVKNNTAPALAPASLLTLIILLCRNTLHPPQMCHGSDWMYLIRKATL